ncbi:MAG: hypothetical protein OEX14_08730, partial [Paracoccaceae bacterium]|nr:hypothetical protein [Paracoccaceae bacterium]
RKMPLRNTELSYPAMQFLHSSIAGRGIVQSQQSAHLVGNGAIRASDNRGKKNGTYNYQPRI